MVAMQASDIKWAQWIRVARNYQLRVGLKDRSRETFDGFVREVSQQRSKEHSSARDTKPSPGPRSTGQPTQATFQCRP